MNRVVILCLAFCLCLGTQEVFAQGLLGKPNVSAQYLLFRAGDDFDGFDTNLGNGGRLQASVPVLIPEAEAAWGAGIDVFGAFSGFGLGSDSPMPDSNFRFLGGDLGASFYTQATDRIRPFAQLGINYTQSELRMPGFDKFKESDTNLILTVGLEADVLPATAIRASYGRGADSFGHTAFLGEIIVQPVDHWFGRFGASIGNDKTVIGGFGLGYAW